MPRQTALELLEFIRKASHHANAIFDLGIVAVMSARRDSAAGFQIDLIAEKREGGSQTRPQILLDLTNLLDCFATELRTHRRQTRIIQIACQTERHNRDAADRGMR